MKYFLLFGVLIIYIKEQIILLIISFGKFCSTKEFIKILNPPTELTKSGLEILAILRNSIQPILNIFWDFAITAIDWREIKGKFESLNFNHICQILI